MLKLSPVKLATTRVASLLALVWLVGCRSAEGTGTDDTALKSVSPEAETATLGDPVLTCTNTDKGSAEMGVDVYRTGFDLQQGTQFELLIHHLGSADLSVGGSGSLDDAALEVLFDRGSLTASAESLSKIYAGVLALDEQSRPLHCLH